MAGRLAFLLSSWGPCRPHERGVGADGLPLYQYQFVLQEMTADCGNKRDDCLLNYYWRIAERCGWDGPAPPGALQGLAGF
jgi:hypothetical protein